MWRVWEKMSRWHLWWFEEVVGILQWSCVERGCSFVWNVYYPWSSFRNQFSFSSVLKSFFHLFVREWGASSQSEWPAQKEVLFTWTLWGWFLATSAISIIIFCHVGCPLALDQTHGWGWNCQLWANYLNRKYYSKNSTFVKNQYQTQRSICSGYDSNHF